MSFGTNNNLTGGGAVTNYRGWNVASSTQTGTTTTHLDQIYIERGTADGTVTNNRAIRINNMQGTNRAAFFVLDIGDGGTNNSYMVLGSDASATIPTGNWGIYQIQSTYNNYFNGKLLVKTTTDAGYALDVNGTARLSGALSGTSATFSGNITFSSAGSTSIGWGGNTSAAAAYPLIYSDNSYLAINSKSGSRLYLNFDNTNASSLVDFFAGKATINKDGAATFSSSVTAAGRINSGNGGGATASLNAQQLSGDDAAIYAGGVSTAGSSKGIKILAGTNSSDYALSVSTYANSPILYARGDGNVGIGTTSPAEKLSVSGAIISTGGITGHGANRTGLSQEGANGAYWQSYGANTTTVGTFTLRQASSDFSVVRSPLTIDTTGAATFSSTLRVQDAIYGADGTSTSASIRFWNANTGLYHPGSDALGIITSGTERMRITSGGRIGIGQTAPGVALSVAGQTESWQLALTNVTGTAGAVIGSPSADVLAFGNWAGTERMRITSGGELLINTTTDSGAYYLQVNGSVYATAYYESSDIRLKDVLKNSYSENFSAIEFMWKDKRDDKKHWGYAAQDVMKYIPDAIEVNNDGMMTVNYNEAHTWKIAQLEKEILELKAKLK